MAMHYATPQVVSGVTETEDGLKMAGLMCYLPSAKAMTPAVRIVAEGLDRFGRFQSGYAVFAVRDANGKRKAVVLPARQETVKTTGDIIWSAAQNRPVYLPVDDEGQSILLDAIADATAVSLDD